MRRKERENVLRFGKLYPKYQRRVLRLIVWVFCNVWMFYDVCVFEDFVMYGFLRFL